MRVLLALPLLVVPLLGGCLEQQSGPTPQARRYRFDD